MKGRIENVRGAAVRAGAAILVFATAAALAADVVQPPPGGWKPRDMNRPRPPVRDPGPPSAKEFAPPPAGAVVLFDGKDLSAWERKPSAKDADKSSAPKWKVADGFMEIVPKSGGIATKETFGDCRIHLEWATPAEVKGDGQGRGNSGVYLPGQCEVQVLDSFGNDTYPDGQAAAIYSRYPPTANVCRRPGEWQSYDITVEQPRAAKDGTPASPRRVTVVHNGVLVQDRVDLGPGGPASGVLFLQDHGNPVRFRNIWVRKLPAPAAP